MSSSSMFAHQDQSRADEERIPMEVTREKSLQKQEEYESESEAGRDLEKATETNYQKHSLQLDKREETEIS